MKIDCHILGSLTPNWLIGTFLKQLSGSLVKGYQPHIKDIYRSYIYKLLYKNALSHVNDSTTKKKISHIEISKLDELEANIHTIY